KTDADDDQNRNGVARFEAEAAHAAHDLVTLPADGVAGDVKRAFGDGDLVVERIFFDDLGRPGIGVYKQRRTQHNKAAGHADDRLGPDGPEREFEAPTLLVPVDDCRDNAAAGEEGEDPAPEGPDRGKGAIAANKLVGLVHRGNGL